MDGVSFLSASKWCKISFQAIQIIDFKKWNQEAPCWWHAYKNQKKNSINMDYSRNLVNPDKF